MDKIWAVSYYTFRESLARKTFIAFFIFSSLILAIFLFALNLDIVDGALSGFSVFGNEVGGTGRVDIKELITGIQSVIAGILFGFGLALSVFATASLIPSMLQKGHIEWMLSKPISRHNLLIGKLIGAVAIVTLNVFYLVGGSWLILSIKSGLWNFPFLFSGVLIVANYVVLFSIMVFLGVIVQNTAISIMGVFFVAVLSPALVSRDKIYALLSEKIYQAILDGIYYLTPRTYGFAEIVTTNVLGKPVQSWQPVWHSLLIGVFFFSLAIYIFKRKNF
jgi:ABC-type transport system involved in multi-copper enzyme maturation permease subunit